MTIHKYPLKAIDKQVVIMPLNSQILTVQMQRDQMYMWAMVTESNTDKEGHLIEIIPTGVTLNDNVKRRYICTVQMCGGSLIWHVFEVEG